MESSLVTALTVAQSLVLCLTWHLYKYLLIVYPFFIMNFFFICELFFFFFHCKIVVARLDMVELWEEREHGDYQLRCCKVLDLGNFLKKTHWDNISLFWHT
jgi:hypothetical protein